MEDLSPMMKQYHEVKRRFPGKLVFFRLGDFYEMFYEDAVVRIPRTGNYAHLPQ